MSLTLKYEAIGRVICEKQVIGLMVIPVNKKTKSVSNSVYMPLEAIVFGLSQKNFEIKNVKLGSNGKPRGCNGFLLSKLPILELEKESDIEEKLQNVILYLLQCFDVNIKEVKIKKSNISEILTLNVIMNIPEYSEIEDKVIANTEFKKTLKFYQKHMPSEYKCFDTLIGEVTEKGICQLRISKSLVREEKENDK